MLPIDTYVISGFPLSYAAEYKNNDTTTFNAVTLKKFVDSWAVTSVEGETVEERIVAGMKDKVELRRLIVDFYHKYVIGVRDLDVIRGELYKGEHIFTQVTASDAAYAALVFVDNYDGWIDTFEKQKIDPSYKNPKDNKTKWNKVNGKTPFLDRIPKEAKSFYEKAVTMFGVFHDRQDELRGSLNGDQQDEELSKMMGDHSREWWRANMECVKVKKRKAPTQVRGSTGPVQPPVVNRGALAAYKKRYKKSNIGEEPEMSSLPDLPALGTAVEEQNIAGI